LTINRDYLGDEDIIPEVGGPCGFADAIPRETNVRFFADTAVLMGVITTGGPQPKEIPATLVHQKTPKGWQIIAASHGALTARGVVCACDTGRHCP
jgi:hypothetical protein